MNSPGRTRSWLVVRWWRSLVGWFRRVLGGAPVQLGAGRSPGRLAAVFGDAADELADDLKDILRSLAGQPGAVVDTVASAIRDYGDLSRIVIGPGATADAVLDVTMLADARAALRVIIVRAPDVQVLLDVARRRPDDRAGREAAGDAMLGLRDRRRALQDLSSAAIQWAASRAPGDRDRLHACAQRVSNAGAGEP